MAHRSKRWSKPAAATTTGKIKADGASASPSIPNGGTSTGRKRVPTTATWAVSSAPTSTYRRARARRTDPTSRCCSIGCRNRSTSSLIWRTAFSTGPTPAILRAATPSIGRRSTKRPRRRYSSRIRWSASASPATFPESGYSLPPSPGRFIPPISMARTSATSSTRRATSPASPMPKSNKTHRRNDMTENKPIRRIAIIGTGVIGASWASLFLAKGLPVVATDIAPNAEASLRKFVETAWPALKRLGLSPGASQSNLKFTADLAQAVAGVDLVQENGPERIDFKQKLYGQLDELLPPDVIIASSSSGLTMSEIQKGAASHPERCVIAHP